ncbi:MAG: DUF2911 domain-containing protein [Lewinellaceae bacterium]|nr:DUF2911 domain-containing protein [Phaeodactylibacter sp.]MCB9351509.1 DUF2911 domain-containing protein [Lewinellaceae bacterium]
MNKLLTIALLLATTLAFLPQADAQDFSDLDKSPMDAAYYPQRAAFRAFAKTDEEKMANQPMIRVLYSRPQMKGREVFGGIVKYGETWRLGANESTEIHFYQDVTINGTAVKAGRYTVYAIPGEKEWEVSFSSDLDNWGAYAYNPEHNVATITVPVEASEKPIEAFSITFDKADDGAHMIMGWEKTVVRVPIAF